MHDSDNAKQGGHHGVSTKAMEIAVAVGILLLGILVMYDNHRIGSGWAEDGPQAGYFPFYVGLILSLASAWALWRAVFTVSDATVFVSHAKLKLVLSVFIPSMIYVVAIYFIGIYVASAIYIGLFMRIHGKFPWIKIAPVSLLVPVAVFMMFEVWFLVPLPKGPFEALIGY